MSRPIDIRDLESRTALVTDKRVSLDADGNLLNTNQPDNSAIGTAASKNVGTAATEIPLNSDLGSASTKDTGTASTNVPLNSDLGSGAFTTVGTASTVDTGTDFDQVPLNTDIVYPIESVQNIAGLIGTQDDQQINIKGWHSGWGATVLGPTGGGILAWDSTRAKSDHNGGAIFSPTVPYSATTADYLNGVGETDIGGTGCWVRTVVDSFSFDEFGALGDGTTDDVVQIQATIDYAGSVSNADARSEVRGSKGKRYAVIASDVQMNNVSINATGLHFFLTGTAGFLVGTDCGFISCNTKILCTAGYTGKVFRKDPSVSGVVHIEMLGRCFIQKVGTVNTAAGYAVDMTSFHRSIIDVEVRNMFAGIYAAVTAANQQTYYNKISIRGSGISKGIYMTTNGFEVCNGNLFDYVSFGSVDYGIQLIALSASGGPGTNTFNIAYIENVNNAGINISGDCRYNQFTGGIIETVNDVEAISLSGAKYNTFSVTPAPASTAKALKARNGCENNNFNLGRYGTWIGWSEDVGVGELWETNVSGGTFIGELISRRSFVTYDTASGGTLVLAGSDYITLTGAGNILEIGASALDGLNEVTLVGNGSATLYHAFGGTYQMILKGAVNTVPGVKQTITLIRDGAFSNDWIEKCRSY
jgi:hypothetical protein